MKLTDINKTDKFPLEWVTLKDQNGNNLHDDDGKIMRFKAGRYRISYSQHEKFSQELTDDDNLLEILPKLFWGFGGFDDIEDMTPKMNEEERSAQFDHIYKVLCANAEVPPALYGYFLYRINISANQSKSRKRR